MKKILLSLVTFMVWGHLFAQYDEQQADYDKYNIEGPELLTHSDSWGVDSDKIDRDKPAYKNQKQSLIDWENIDPNKWLDYFSWKEKRDYQDKNPKWKVHLRDRLNQEILGKVVQCVFKCTRFRGLQEDFVQYRSHIKEGDEVQTSDDSYLWIVLVDGTLIRLSPNSSITFNEVNIGKSRFFYNLRLNYGHFHWQPRKLGEYKAHDLSETDQVFFPLLEGRANREYYAKLEHQLMTDEEQMQFVLAKNPGHVSQYERLNKLLKKNEENFKLWNTTLLLVTANTTIHNENAIMDVFFDVNGKSLVRHLESVSSLSKDDPREELVQLHFRGYTNKDSLDISPNTWYEINKEGLSAKENSEIDQKFHLLDLFLKRIPTIHLLRELVMHESYDVALQKPEEITEKDLALNYGYRLWDLEDKKEIEIRLKYLLEYFRRVETTNLFSLKKVFKDKKEKTFDDSYTQYALESYMKYLKNRFGKKRLKIKEMTDTQFYLWVIKHGKKHIPINFSK